jgi:hydrogenase-4 component B
MATQQIATLLMPGAFGLFGLGLLIALMFGRRVNEKLQAAILLAACACMFISALCAWPVGYKCGPLPVFLGGMVHISQHADALSLLFLLILSFVGMAVAIFTPSYVHHLQGKYHPGIFWFALLAFVASMAQTLLSVDAINFIVFWEIMSLSSVALVITDYASHRAKHAALIYLAATRISTTFLLAGFIWLFTLSHSWLFADWHSLGPAATVPMFLLFTGFCIKAGSWPFHLWLPYAHTEAPAPVSALMSGVMVKVAVYGIIRLLLVGSDTSPLLAYAAIILGSISSLWGIVFAQVYNDLKRILAYSTVENIGLIILALGLVMWCKTGPVNLVASVALAAALFHCINHSVYKPLLFLSTGAVDVQAHSRTLSRLGGLHKSMPWTAALFFVGAMSICALPPLNGFASKWLIYQGLFQFASGSIGVVERVTGLAIMGVLAMVGALSVAAFTKSFGLCFLGRARTAAAENATEASFGAIAAQALLAFACIGLSLFSTIIVQQIAPAAAGIVPGYVAFQGYAAPPLVIAMLALIASIYLLFLRNQQKVKFFVTWECGYGELPRRTLMSGISFNRSIMDLFGRLVQIQESRQINGMDRRHFPDSITVKVENYSLIERYVYVPMLHIITAASEGLAKLQTASIHVHLFYVFATLIVAIIVGTQKW